MLKAFVVLAVIAAAAVGVQRIWSSATRPLDAPPFSPTEFWGHGAADKAVLNDAIEAQEIYYPQEVIAQLYAKLNETLPLHRALEGMTHSNEYGLNPSVVHKLVKYWRDEYLPKWPQRLELLNSVPHFKTEIQGLSIHYVHIKPQPVSGKTIVPLLILHGWPGSVREFYDIFPLLTQPNDASPYLFEVIAPSLPGFGWSDGAARVGFGPAQVAVVLRNLMLRVGHTRFVVQGGDWGSIVGSHLATLFPQNVIGYHSNMCSFQSALSTAKLWTASLYPSAFVDSRFASWIFPVGEKYKFLIRESGYFHLQATKPDTIGIALTGNPVGMAAYHYEKFLGAFPGHNLDDILDIQMIYYLTNSAHTSMRLYAEAMTAQQRGYELHRVPVQVPVACSRFVRDISHMLDWQLRDKYPNLVQSTWHEDGGHFAAMEVPQTLYADFVEFVGKIKVE